MANGAALIQHLVLVAAQVAAAGHGNKESVYATACRELRMSRATLLRKLNEVSVKQERKRRTDAGTSRVTREEAVTISAALMATLRKSATTSAGNIRFVAESTPDGHADRFWALALAIHAASDPAAPIDFMSDGPRAAVTETEGFFYG
jgi:phage FluMu gp28-like protein